MQPRDFGGVRLVEGGQAAVEGDSRVMPPANRLWTKAPALRID